MVVRSRDYMKTAEERSRLCQVLFSGLVTVVLAACSGSGSQSPSSQTGSGGASQPLGVDGGPSTQPRGSGGANVLGGTTATGPTGAGGAAGLSTNPLATGGSGNRVTVTGGSGGASVPSTSDAGIDGGVADASGSGGNAPDAGGSGGVTAGAGGTLGAGGEGTGRGGAGGTTGIGLDAGDTAAGGTGGDGGVPAPQPSDGPAPDLQPSDGPAPDLQPSDEPMPDLQPSDGPMPAPSDSGSDAQAFAEVGDAATRLVVLPMLFVPADVTFTPPSGVDIHNLLVAHMEVAQRRYQLLLETDSFQFEVEAPAVYRSARVATTYDQATSPDSAHLMAKELLDWKSEDRNRSRHVFCALLVRPPSVSCGATRPCVGGGRTFNGPPGTGGGIIQLEYSALMSDSPYPMQSTLIHELGHAFGLADSDCLGEDMQTGQSLMSYNPAHWSSGTVESATPGIFLPEHYFILDQAKTAFPAFHFSQPIHNPTDRPLVKVDGHCQLGAMDASLGPMDRLGYQLFFDGQPVNGPETKFWTLGAGKDNCAWNLANNGNAHKIRCTYDGMVIGTNE